MFNAFIVIIANWISFWDLRLLKTFTMGTVIFAFVIAFSNYLQAALVCPEIGGEGQIDLERFHAAQGRRYSAAFVATMFTALAANLYLGTTFNIAEWVSQNAVVIPMLAMALLATIFVHSRPVQAGIAIVTLALWTYYFNSLQGALS
jgi:hypothetical protein